ncbi:MAG: porin [Verrucomicrobia bacterium]|nr:porin [Verrucomicrobiota bacterium]
MKGIGSRMRVFLLGLLAASVVAGQALAEDLNVYWKEGLRADSEDGAFKLKVGGRIMVDMAWFDLDAALDDEEDPLDEAIEFRRARLYFSGTIYDSVEFKAQYDFAGGEAALKDMYIGILNVGPGTVRVGHFKEPFSLEEITSSKYVTLMEGSLANTFSPSRNVGIGYLGNAMNERITYGAGIFRETDDFGEFAGGSDYNLTARVTGVPLYEDKGERLLHLGAAYSHRKLPGDEVRYRARPEAHLSTRFVDTGDFEAEEVDLIGVEAAAVFGPLSVQGEYIMAAVQSAASGDPDFAGYYVEASYFLTGEHRRYKLSEGAFDRVRPNRNLMVDGGMGAVQLTARYSSIDLTDGTIEGGEMDDITLGANWYLNPNTRIMLNYVNSDVSGVGEADIVQMRFQIDF